ncbi:bifunctional DNA primase/polymerase-like protein [Roseibium hamelinense]|uniref:Bifunctional DNA primase/polymerase-like protein n=1 Tax=Roseibium hamelinense TaxID=150831 RepID=A0A562T0J1_9HYPH|nr:bifunctional DNA primase/polymerase [Roseibium hamelinense]MTI42032.1 bifunctional DNA primase/polymerase [Roseibium hamelinense]TWI87049.1 bifunctional DNA primase/polymerase-like protein [Roseibium hamelinense]
MNSTINVDRPETSVPDRPRRSLAGLSFETNGVTECAQDEVAAFESRLLAAALDYADQGKHVFPCRPNKRPFTVNGFKAATAEASQIKAWWAQFPQALIGIATGTISDLIVLDVDMKNGNGFLELERLGLGHWLLAGRHVNTPSGGAHIWFEQADQTTRNSAGKIAPNVDVRGDGGYVIAPPSRPELNKPGYEFLFEGDA